MSQEYVTHDHELNSVESALGSLVPSRSRVDRDRVMFLVGQASVRRSSIGSRAWVAVAASLAMVAIGEGALLMRRPPVEVVERVVYVPQPAPSAERIAVELGVPVASQSSRVDFAMAKRSLDQLTAQLLRFGLDGLPEAPAASWGSAGPSPVSSQRLLQEELRKILDPGGPS